jgi:hypothetical protein
MILRPLLAIAALWSVAAAHNIQLKAHSRECFHETLHVDDTMTVTFQVGDREFGGSGNLDIDFWVLQYSSARRGASPKANKPDRSRTRKTATKFTSDPYPLATIPSLQSKMDDSHTASATNIGRRIRKRCRSMCMALSTCRSRRLLKIRLRKKVEHTVWKGSGTS